MSAALFVSECSDGTVVQLHFRGGFVATLGSKSSPPAPLLVVEAWIRDQGATLAGPWKASPALRERLGEVSPDWLTEGVLALAQEVLDAS